MWHAAASDELPTLVPIYHFYIEHGVWELEPVQEQFGEDCDVRISRPAFVWGLSPDDVFGHFVTESLVTLFATMRAFWGADVAGLDATVFRHNLLLRLESWERLAEHNARRRAPNASEPKRQRIGRSHHELLRLITDGPLDAAVEDIRWRSGYKACFDTVVVGQDFLLQTRNYPAHFEDPRGAGWADFRAAFRKAAGLPSPRPVEADQHRSVLLEKRHTRRLLNPQILAAIVALGGATVEHLSFCHN